MQVSLTNVLNEVRSDRVGPECCADARLNSHGSRVNKNVSIWVVAYEVAPTQYVQSGGPFMGMHRCSLAGRNLGVENADLVVFQQNPMVVRRLGHCIERMRGRTWRDSAFDAVHRAGSPVGIPNAAYISNQWPRSESLSLELFGGRSGRTSRGPTKQDNRRTV